MRRVAALHTDDRDVSATSLLPFLVGDAAPALTPIERAADERSRILSAYQESGGNKSRLAKLLGVSRKTLYARLKRLDLDLS